MVKVNDSLKKFGFVVLLVYLFTLVPKVAWAHAYLVSSNPAENETLTEPPSKVTLQFSESIQSGFHSIVLVDSSGDQIMLSDSIGKDASILEAPITEELAAGIYYMQWKVISADGHPIHGAIPFNVEAAQKGTDPVPVEEPGSNPDSNPVPAATGGDNPTFDVIALRWLLYMGLSLFIGVIVCNLFIIQGPPQQQAKSMRVIWASLIAISIALLLNLPLQTTLYAGVSWSEAFTLSLLKETAEQTTVGTVWVFQLLLLVILWLFAWMATLIRSEISVRNWSLPLLASVGLLVSKAFTSHAAGSENPILAVTMDFLHLLASSVWVGGLFTVVFLLPRGDLDSTNERQDYWKSLHRFSLWAMIAVAIILLTGIYGSLLYVPTWYSLFHSPYGKVLLGKILLFSLMVMLGAFHFLRTRKKGNTGIHRTAWFELALGISVLIIVTILTNLPTAASSPGPFKVTQKVQGGHSVTLEISPNVAGHNTFQIDVRNTEGETVTDIEQVTLSLNHMDMEMEENTVIVTKKSPGHFQTEGLYMNMNGKWRLSVHVLTSSLDSYGVEFHPTVGTK
ncbi:copper resistance protein CopC [Peribacillus glennii]|nr:copper resistance protein CopC [Peribacillus glennii]